MATNKVDLKVFTNIGELLTLQGVVQKNGRHVQEADLGSITKAALVCSEGKVVWFGPQKKLPKSFLKSTKSQKVQLLDLDGKTVMPGFVECHTHLIFAGDRSHEFELRNQGVSYQDISRQGGGILSTVKATRKISVGHLKTLSQTRVNKFTRQGVTTLEVKSGYGLDLVTEIKMLKIARALSGPHIVTTYLGPHAVAPEYATAQEYLHEIIERHLPKIAKSKLADRVDIFVDRGFFTVENAKEYFAKATELGLKLTVHGDQLSATGASVLGAHLNAQSVDHAIELSDQDIKNIAQSNTTVVALPSADFYLKLKYPRVRELIDQGARVALATDFNPGSSPTQNLSLVGVLARIQMKMTLPEVISAYTFNAAAGLGLETQKGALDLGFDADFVIVDGSWRDLFYQVGHHPVINVFRSARQIL
jgi:imidazolonepropionase